MFAFIALTQTLFAQPLGVKVTREDSYQKTRILFILDCSSTMYAHWQSNTKIKIAQSGVINRKNKKSQRKLATALIALNLSFFPI